MNEKKKTTNTTTLRTCSRMIAHNQQSIVATNDELSLASSDFFFLYVFFIIFNFSFVDTNSYVFEFLGRAHTRSSCNFFFLIRNRIAQIVEFYMHSIDGRIIRIEYHIQRS